MNNEKGQPFIMMGFFAFAAIAMDGLLMLLIEPVLYKNQWPEWTTVQYAAHFITICIIWGSSAYFLIRLAKHKYNFPIMAKGGKLSIKQWAIVFFSMIFLLAFNYYQWQGFKAVAEFHKKGAVIFCFQYLYYFFETILFSLIIVFGQKACEVWFKKRNFPYGGIVVAISWGLGHIASKGSVTVGLVNALAGFIFGVVYLLVQRDFKKTVLILYIMFAF